MPNNISGSELDNKSPNNYKAVVVGTALGGTSALAVVLSYLPGNFNSPIIIVQHFHPFSDGYLIWWFNKTTKIKVKQADEEEKIKPGVAYFAPPDRHLVVEKDRTFSLANTKKVNYVRPSIDVLFKTAAGVYGKNLVGIILTGASNDGSQGLKRIKEEGGFTIVQDPKTAKADEMPRSAIDAVQIDYILPLDEIGMFLQKFLNF